MIALLADIGNSRIKWRIGSFGPRTTDVRWKSSEQALALGDLAHLPAGLAGHADVAVEAVLLSNVADDVVEAALRASVSRCWPDATVRSLRPTRHQCGVVNGYRDATRLGPDRWLAMIGAHAGWRERTLLVCSFGTATTIDLLVAAESGDARFVGGLILPGFETMRASLAGGTARLPMADGRTVDFAQDTDDAITSGIAAAQAGAVERAWRKAGGSKMPAICVLAGGGATTMAALLTDLDMPFAVAHDLVLRGMATVATEMAPAAGDPTGDATPTR